MMATRKIVAMVFLMATSMGHAMERSFVSDDSWSVSDSTANPVGMAQYVCVASTQPGCPVGAAIYDPAASGHWPADLSTVPGAEWIWAPGLSGSTPNASLAAYSFSKTFPLGPAPLSGHISIAADDFAQIFVNGTSVGSIGSITNESVAAAAQSALTEFDLSAYLRPGNNTITILGRNGPDAFAGATHATYAQNTAAVVFAGTLSDASANVAAPLLSAPVLSGWILALLALGIAPAGWFRFRSHRAERP